MSDTKPKIDPKDDYPICTKCKTKSVLKNAGIFNDIFYWYCKKCKIEVKPTGKYTWLNDDLDEFDDFDFEII